MKLILVFDNNADKHVMTTGQCAILFIATEYNFLDHLHKITRFKLVQVEFGTASISSNVLIKIIKLLISEALFHEKINIGLINFILIFLKTTSYFFINFQSLDICVQHFYYKNRVSDYM